jgi:hypothetical protein
VRLSESFHASNKLKICELKSAPVGLNPKLLGKNH